MVKEGKYIIYEYDIEDKELVDIVDSYIDENAERIIDFFELKDFHDKAKLKIWKTKQDFDKRVKERRNNGQDVPKWTVGVSDFVGNIDVVSLNDYQNTSHSKILENKEYALDYFKKNILHEYVHYINNIYSKNINNPYPLKCLTEGIAQYLSNQKENIKDEFNYSLEDILNSNNCYDGWFLLIKYIINNYSYSYLLSLFSNNNYATKEIEKIINDYKMCKIL